MKFIILGTPQPKQSARFRAAKIGDKIVMKSYQKSEVVQNERNIAFDIKSQLPIGFIPYDEALGMKVLFVFPPLKTFSKKKTELMLSGVKIYKETKPDLTDNLMKGLCDAMNGIVFIDDARVCKVDSEKIYGIKPRIEIEFYKLT